jgi:glycosidase
MRYSLAPAAALLTFAAVARPAPAQERDTSWVARSALYEVFVQDFSPQGTFRGVIDGLERIQASGANVVWVMPIQPIGVVNRKGVLGSPYAALDYRAINPALGTADDFKALVQAAHARGMKVILDWVPDHTSPDNSWVREHPDYYVHNDQGEPSVPRDAAGKLTDWTDVVQLDYKNPALRRAMIDLMSHWLTEYGLDGFRVDVAGFIPTDFWREAIPALRAAVPRRILLLAEWGDPEWNRAGFDLIYSWDSYRRLKAVWKGAPASVFVDSEVVEMRAMPPGGMKMRFTTNHDETAWDNPPVAIFGRGAGARAAFVAAALLPGRPLLYNGQEVESPQKLPLFDKEAVVWDQPNAEQARTFYRRVIELACTEPALIAGDFVVVATNAPNDVIAYRRGGLVVLVNPRPREINVTVTGIEVKHARDLLSNRVLQSNRVTMPGYGAMVLRWGGH